MVIYSYLQSQ